MAFGLNKRNLLYIVLGLIYLLFVIILFVGAGLITKVLFEGEDEDLKKVGINSEEVKICRFTMIISWFMYIVVFIVSPIYFIFVR